MSKKSYKKRKMQKNAIIIVIAVIVVLVVLAVALLAGANANPEQGHNHNSEITLKVALNANKGDIHYKSVEKFKEEVENVSNGTIHVEIHESGKLGDSEALIRTMGQKDAPADIVLADVADFNSIDNRMDISSLPFLFDEYEAAYAFMEGSVQKEIEESMIEKHVRVLSHYSDGFEYITTSDKMIINAQDMQTLSFALKKESYMIDALRAFQAKGILVEPGKVQNALVKKEYSGYIGTMEEIYGNQIYLVQSSVAVTYHSYHSLAFAISEHVWDTLSEEQQEIVKMAATKSAQTDRSMMEQYEFNAIKNIESSGVRVVYPNVRSFKTLVTPIYNNYRARYGNLLDTAITGTK